MHAQFTPREIAELAGAPKSTVERAIEEKIFAPKMVKRGKRERRMLPGHAVAYARIMGRVKYRMDVDMKKRLAATLAKLKAAEFRNAHFMLEPAVDMDIGLLVGDVVERAERYGSARDKLIVEDENILGGTPIISGTRISVYSVLGRIKGGDTVEDILADYPEISGEAVEAAVIFAKAHPLVGRPGGRPWASAA